jgi:hypothetical protein
LKWRVREILKLEAFGNLILKIFKSIKGGFNAQISPTNQTIGQKTGDVFIKDVQKGKFVTSEYDLLKDKMQRQFSNYKISLFQGISK